MKALLIGDSDIGALRLALQARSERGESPPEGVDLEIRLLARGDDLISRFFRRGPRRITLTKPGMSARIPQLPMSADISVYGLSAPLRTFRLMRRVDWRQFAPVHLRRGDEAPVSQAVLRALILEDQVWILRFIDSLKDIGLNLFAVEAPRVSKQHQFLRAGVRTEVGLYLDQEYRRVMREELAHRSIPVIDLPTETYDEEGFMLPEFVREGDPYHGSANLGEAILQRVYAHLERLRPTSSKRRPVRGDVGLATPSGVASATP